MSSLPAPQPQYYTQQPEFCAGPNAHGHFPGLVVTRTNHVLHVLLTFFTAGLWAVIWVLVGISNASTNSKRIIAYNVWVAERIGEPVPRGYPGWKAGQRLIAEGSSEADSAGG